MPKNTILAKMLDRLFAGLVSGPNLNCRPHSSRQRIDWTQFTRLQDASPGEALRQLLSDKQAAQLQARVTAPKNPGKSSSGRKKGDFTNGGEATTETPDATSIPESSDEATSPDDRKSKDAWSAQQTLLTKLRALAEDARDYEQDTGVHVLHVGFPLLSLPPGAGSLKSTPGGSKRLLAPIAFIPVSLELRAGLNPVIAIEGLHDGADFLVPNEALFAWLERQTGKSLLPEPQSASPAGQNGIADDPTSTDSATSSHREPLLNPWDEVNDLTRRVCTALDLPPCVLTPESILELRPAPKSDGDNSQAEIVPAAVLGLFPMNNQGLLRDMQSMVAQPEPLPTPVQNFISTDTLLEEFVEPTRGEARLAIKTRTEYQAESERLVTVADPCQARAVRLARDCPSLVIHGPPGTGKSQTITNIIGDHLSRGQRVLLVCDKRTALDVVARRLEHIGLGSLCALIHDPQHDQRNLYMQIREQLEALTDATVGDKATAQLVSLDRQLQKSHDTLSTAWSLVMSPDAQRGVSFHQRMGEWLKAATPSLVENSPTDDATHTPRPRDKQASNQATEPASVELHDAHLSEIRDLVNRAAKIRFADHPWSKCAGIPLRSFLERPVSQIQQNMAAMVDASKRLDPLSSGGLPFLLPTEPTSFPEQTAARKYLVSGLRRCLSEVPPSWRKQWLKASQATVDRARQRLSQGIQYRDVIQSGPLDPKLEMVYRDAKPSITDVTSQIGALEAYLHICDAWYAWLAFGVRSRANAVLRAYGLPPGKTSALRLRDFLSGVSARVLVTDLLREQTPADKNTAPSDEDLLAACERLELLLQVLHESSQHPALVDIQPRAQLALAGNDDKLVTDLESSISHGEALEALRLELTGSGLFHADWVADSLRRVGRGEPLLGDLQRLSAELDSLEDVLRIQSLLTELPVPLRTVVKLAITTTSDANRALNDIQHRVLADEIDQWLKSNPQLQALDGTQLTHLHREMHRLQGEKQTSVRDSVLDLWIRRQRERLLAMTGTRLNSQGADLRRRLTTRGERAMRLRQVIAVGSKIEGGDPLFDLRPVWMASPETVAQIFPRDALFDVVIFDEASQCRLEEALPVLTRAKRVVVAGDPKQLPPTRFFESAVITSDNSDAETEQELFEVHQGETEDLLTAALSLEIQESHLDVHYRSRNADLVEFSNQQFYGNRLQAIPGHPRNRIRFAPITLYQVAGVYEDRTNPTEAAQVVRIVADLLRRSEPPSIGIACFNLTQRDLILDSLAELATEDNEFAGRLAVARNRVGSGAFEGLFVKNLENVQGDERDHMIISTTYGPDKQGKFYRRFGPLGQVGGGRRLNVLITRAREEVHLVTSIPPGLYRNLPPIPDGQQPGGGWLLFAYLDYAERLGQSYAEWRKDNPEAETSAHAKVIERPSRTPSSFATNLAQLMATRKHLSSDTCWGNDGFCVDIAFHHPGDPEDRTLGLLCDGTRFQYTDDPVAWDVFRMAVLEEQGWQLRRCWTPQFFRDPTGHVHRIATDAAEAEEGDHESDE